MTEPRKLSDMPGYVKVQRPVVAKCSSAAVIALLTVLACRTWSDGKCNPSLATLAADLKSSRRAVIGWIKQAEKDGVLTVQRTKGTSHYTIRSYDPSPFDDDTSPVIVAASTKKPNKKRKKVPGELCHYCGNDGNETVDHVIPQCQGGSDDPANLVPCCKRCNSSKGGRTPGQWYWSIQDHLETCTDRRCERCDGYGYILQWRTLA